jgi:hypothetical protein
MSYLRQSNFTAGNQLDIVRLYCNDEGVKGKVVYPRLAWPRQQKNVSLGDCYIFEQYSIAEILVRGTHFVVMYGQTILVHSFQRRAPVVSEVADRCANSWERTAVVVSGADAGWGKRYAVYLLQRYQWRFRLRWFARWADWWGRPRRGVNWVEKADDAYNLPKL